MKHLIPVLLAVSVLCACSPRRGDDDDDDTGSTLSDGAFLLYPDDGAGYTAAYLWVPREDPGAGCDEFMTPGGLQTYDDDEDYLYVTLYVGNDLGSWERDYEHFYTGNCGYDEVDPDSAGQMHCFTGNNFPGPEQPMDPMLDAVLALDSYSESSVRGEVTYGDGVRESFRVEHCGVFAPDQPTPGDEPGEAPPPAG